MSTYSNIQNSLWVLRSQEGDARAFTELVAHWDGRLRKHAERLTGDRHAADDIVQEAWTAVMHGLRTLDDANTFPKWVFRIVTNKGHDWIRRQQRYRWLKAAFSREASRLTGEPASDGHATDSVEQAMSVLPPAHRAAVLLHYFEGFTMTEIAQILAVPPGTVKSRLSEARQRMRAYLEETEHEHAR